MKQVRTVLRRTRRPDGVRVAKKSEDVLGSPKTLTVIGCGGVLWAGIPQMTTWLHRRGDIRVHLIDGDTVSNTNLSRQWCPKVLGYNKATAAAQLLATLTSKEIPIYDHPEMVNVSLLANYGLRRVDEYAVVVSIPDSHYVRCEIHKTLCQLSEELKFPVFEVTAGNTAKDGYAYLCMHYKGETYLDYLFWHPDMQESADAEAAGKEKTYSCGRAKATEEQVIQTVAGNQLTAHCLWSLLDTLVEDMNTWSHIAEEMNPTPLMVKTEFKWIQPINRHTEISWRAESIAGRATDEENRKNAEELMARRKTESQKEVANDKVEV